MAQKSASFKKGVHRGRPRKQTKFLGPVANLEEHVPPDWWRTLFGPVYLKTDGDVVEDTNLTRTEVDVILEILQPSPDAAILDLCCGQGRHSLELARRGYTGVCALDRSRYLIQKAKNQARKEGLNVAFKEGDARKLPYPDESFDYVLLLGNSFGYFESIRDDILVLREVMRVLKPMGKVFIDVADGEYLRNNFKARSWEWIDKRYFVCRERSLSTDRTRLISREIVIHAQKGVVVDQFYSERLYSEKSLKELLEKSGFSEITFHGEFVPQSSRNQDLGMMEQRILVTARVNKQKKRVQKKGLIRSQKEIVVLLGDPKQKDFLKPGTVFDEDDFYTIEQLKEALSRLERFRFTFLDNHGTLIRELIGLKGKVDLVLNFCDEGFKNDPYKELHIPALLEMLDLPYTGSGPQCLAYCYDKSLVRGVAREMGVPVPRACFIKPEDMAFSIPIAFPVIVKPNFGDSSFGITEKSVCFSLEELVEAIAWIREKLGYTQPILVEEFLTGKDLSVGIIGNLPDNYIVLPITEEDYSELPPDLPRICGYEAKWLPDSPYGKVRSVKAEIPESIEKLIVEHSLKLIERFGCRDYVRLDWRLDEEGYPRLLEINPNPGWCYDGHLAKMAAIGGMSYSELLQTIIETALLRIERQ
ncbi:MAG: D-alanine-D-alanine ligase [Candidatus Atribacteria bacterium]|uniref:methyltransferase domain-containing protein n=1 Tax=Atrimonas thermophila TaxID=3064161 RepID=UPI0024AA6F9F|nr:D-alanine-D-alanine ligase [Candidatus Atribacteria bacterium]MDI3531066.1 D-alanine-D-alanine ligase [Candidatus Atribacteria bacterium]